MLKLLVLLVGFLFVNALDALAQAGKVALEHGMSMAQVAGLWGEASEKIQYEIKREERWIYAEGEVLFRAGQVVDWQAAPGTKIRQLQDQQTAKDTPKEVAPHRNVPLEEILGEIVREVGEDS